MNDKPTIIGFPIFFGGDNSIKCEVTERALPVRLYTKLIVIIDNDTVRIKFLKLLLQTRNCFIFNFAFCTFKGKLTHAA